MLLLDLLIRLPTHHSCSFLLVFLLFVSLLVFAFFIYPLLATLQSSSVAFSYWFLLFSLVFLRQSPILQIPCIHISFVSSYTPSLIMDRHFVFFPLVFLFTADNGLSGYLIVFFSLPLL